MERTQQSHASEEQAQRPVGYFSVPKLSQRGLWLRLAGKLAFMHGRVLLWVTLCHKEPAQGKQETCWVFWHSLLGALLPAGSLRHKDSWLPCTERMYYRRPYAIKNQGWTSKKDNYQGLSSWLMRSQISNQSTVFHALKPDGFKVRIFYVKIIAVFLAKYFLTRPFSLCTAGEVRCRQQLQFCPLTKPTSSG